MSFQGYVFRRTVDGIHIIHLGKAWEKIQVAARSPAIWLRYAWKTVFFDGIYLGFMVVSWDLCGICTGFMVVSWDLYGM